MRQAVVVGVIAIAACWVYIEAASPYKRVCYYYDPVSLPIEKVNFTVCTHVIYYGVMFNEKNWTFFWPKPTDAAAIETLKQLRTKSGFKLMAVLGGDLVFQSSSQENMDKFANATVSFLRQTELEGLDTDWEFPKTKYKEPFANLMRSLRKAFDAAGEPHLLLSMAATGNELLLLESYDIPSLAQSLDFLDIMGYDYRAWEEGFYLTAHHSSLYATKYDIVYMNTLNLNWSANYFANHGMPREKIILGLPAYAHGWTLLSTLDHGMFALATGPATPASLNFYDVCKFIKTNGTTRVWDSYAQSPYAYNKKEWYSFDDLQSVTVKANYIKQYGFGGVMIWSLIGDADFNHQCGTTTDFPIHSLLTQLLG